MMKWQTWYLALKNKEEINYIQLIEKIKARKTKNKKEKEREKDKNNEIQEKIIRILKSRRQLKI